MLPSEPSELKGIDTSELAQASKAPSWRRDNAVAVFILFDEASASGISDKLEALEAKEAANAYLPSSMLT